MPHGDWPLARSRLACWLRFAVCVAAVLATLQVAPQTPGQWLLLVACWALLLTDGWVTRRRSVGGLSLRAGQWLLWSADDRLPAHLLRYHGFGAGLVVLTFAVGAGRIWRVNVFSDMMAPADFRRLRLALQALRA